MSHPKPSYRDQHPALYIEMLLKVQQNGDALNAIRRIYTVLKERERWGRERIRVTKAYIESTGRSIERARAEGDEVGEGHYLIALIRRYNHNRHQQRQEAKRMAEVMKLVKRNLRDAQIVYAETKTHFNSIYQGEPSALYAYINEEVKK